MEIDGESLERLTAWILSDPSGREGDRQLIMTFLASVSDGSWPTRWHKTQNLAPEHGSVEYVVDLRDGLQLVIVLDYEAVPDLMQVAVIRSLD